MLDLGTAEKLHAIKTFGLKGSEEIFHRSAVVRAAESGHRRLKVIFLTQVKVCLRGVLRPLVAVEGNSISGHLFLHSILFGLALNPALHAAAAIGLFAALLTGHDKIDQPLIFWRLALPVPSSVITAAGYLKGTAHGFYAVFATKSFDDAILQFHLLPTSDRKLRSSSTCIRNSTISWLRRVPSSAGFFWGRPFGRWM